MYQIHRMLMVLLIVPQGIEIDSGKFAIKDENLLIVPQGIEIINDKQCYEQMHLLIVPKGIEISTVFEWL